MIRDYHHGIDRQICLRYKSRILVQPEAGADHRNEMFGEIKYRVGVMDCLDSGDPAE